MVRSGEAEKTVSKGTLDTFFGTTAPKPQEKCSNPQCHHVFAEKETRFKLRTKGEEKLLCMACYKAKLKPLEENEESL